jgi:hypothetical protein
VSGLSSIFFRSLINMMQKQQKQPLKFVIHSKLEQLGGEQSALVEENDLKPSVIAEDSPESSNASTAVTDKSNDNDRKRKRNERDAIPMATKKVSG